MIKEEKQIAICNPVFSRKKKKVSKMKRFDRGAGITYLPEHIRKSQV
jgi:hypothetical protein